MTATVSDAAGTAEAFRSGARSAVEIARAALDAATRNQLGAFWHVLYERALADPHVVNDVDTFERLAVALQRCFKHTCRQ